MTKSFDCTKQGGEKIRGKSLKAAAGVRPGGGKNEKPLLARLIGSFIVSEQRLIMPHAAYIR